MYILTVPRGIIFLLLPKTCGTLLEKVLNPQISHMILRKKFICLLWAVARKLQDFLIAFRIDLGAENKFDGKFLALGSTEGFRRERQRNGHHGIE